jgi:hypothetical protein
MEFGYARDNLTPAKRTGSRYNVAEFSPAVFTGMNAGSRVPEPASAPPKER